MPHTDPASGASDRETAPAAPQARNAQYTQSMTAFGKLVEQLTPWLFEMGDWTFGGVIALTLLIMASLITVGPVDPAITVSTAAFALTLPLAVTGLVLLKLVQDLKRVGFEEEVTRAFQEAGFSVEEQVPALTDLEALRKRRTRIVLGYCLGLLALNAILTVTGMIAALWHIAWWIGTAFFVMVLISPLTVVVVMAAAQAPRVTAETAQPGRARKKGARTAKDQ